MEKHHEYFENAIIIRLFSSAYPIQSHGRGWGVSWLSWGERWGTSCCGALIRLGATSSWADGVGLCRCHSLSFSLFCLTTQFRPWRIYITVHQLHVRPREQTSERCMNDSSAVKSRLNTERLTIILSHIHVLGGRKLERTHTGMEHANSTLPGLWRFC